LTRQRFDAGVSDNVEVVQSQESVANAELDSEAPPANNNIREAAPIRFSSWLVTLLRCGEWRSVSLGFAQRRQASDLGLIPLAHSEFLDECGTY